MERRPLSIPEIALISGTRGALGAGLGLLLADRLNDDQRRAVGWTLFLVGAISTIPIAAQLFESGRPSPRAMRTPIRTGEPVTAWE
jgi:hypothetical protein